MELSKYNQLHNLQGAAIMVDQNHEHLELFSVMVWSIMTQRNQVRLNKLNCSPHSITPLAKERLQEFKVVNPPPPSFQTASPSTQKWKPPAHRMVKINCDGARFTRENRAGIRVVIRDSDDMILGSLSKQIPQAYSPLEVEAMAATTAIQFASDLGFQHAILEINSHVIVKALRDDTEFLFAVGLVSDDIRHNASFFNELHYSNVKREANNVAHKLARHTIYVLDFAVWMEDVPSLLFPSVLADIANFT